MYFRYLYIVVSVLQMERYTVIGNPNRVAMIHHYTPLQRIQTLKIKPTPNQTQQVLNILYIRRLYGIGILEKHTMLLC